MNKTPDKNLDNNNIFSKLKRIKMAKRDTHKFLFNIIGRLFERY